MSEIVERYREWVAALKSEKYEQGEGELYALEIDSYCCLGVLGALLPNCTYEETYIEQPLEEGKFYLYKEIYLPEELRNQFYLGDSCSFLKDSPQLRDWEMSKDIYTGIFHQFKGEALDELLAHLNDHHTLPFPVIAEFIELFIIPYVEKKEKEKNESSN